MKNLLKLENIEFFLILPLLFLALLWTKASILLCMICGTITLVYFTLIMKTKFLIKLINIILLLLLLLFEINFKNFHYLFYVLAIVLACKNLKIKNKPLTHIVFIVFTIYLLWTSLVIFKNNLNITLNIVIIIYTFYHIRNIFQKWDIKKLSFKNYYFKTLIYLLMTLLYGFNILKLYESNISKNNINYFEIYLPIIGLYILYIIINPIIKKEAIV